MYAACAEYLYSQRLNSGERKLVDGEACIDTPSQRNKPGSELNVPLVERSRRMWIGICDSAKRILGTPEAFLEKAFAFSGQL